MASLTAPGTSTTARATRRTTTRCSCSRGSSSSETERRMITASGGRGALLAASLFAAVTVRPEVAQHPTAPAPSPSAITPAMITLGDSVFHGTAGGGTCAVCHGANAKGTPGLAPDLTDAKWLNGDGSYGSIVGVVQQGVAEPKESTARTCSALRVAPPIGGMGADGRGTPER